MFGKMTWVTSWLVLMVLPCHGATAAEPTSQTEAYVVKTFTRAALLRRFDTSRDGELDANERAGLCLSFGGIDVPMLPTKSYRYSVDEAPSYITTAELRQADNTPDDNAISDAGAALGRVLFYDKRLSKNNTIACASCHLQENAFADPRQFSRGFEGGLTKRNAMTLVNLRYSILRGTSPGFFWDERAATLEEQVLMPIQDPVEMGMKLGALENKLQSLPYYPLLFEAAFGSSTVTRDGISKAVAQFMRSMTSFNSKFDVAATASDSRDYSEDFEGFTAAENMGKSLFIEGVAGVAEIGCAHCHIPPTFGMPKSFNTGLDLYYVDKGLGLRDVPSNDPFTPTNAGKFKASSLRNVAVTAPYMHDGRFKTLERVLEHYSDGVHPHQNLGLAFTEQPTDTAKTSGFRLTQSQQSALVAFLKTLTDQTFLTDARFSDPFIRVPE